MKRKLVIRAGIEPAVLAAIGVVLWHFMTAPLYQPGMARAAGPARASPSGHDEQFRNDDQRGCGRSSRPVDRFTP